MAGSVAHLSVRGRATVGSIAANVGRPRSGGKSVIIDSIAVENSRLAHGGAAGGVRSAGELFFSTLVFVFVVGRWLLRFVGAVFVATLALDDTGGPTRNLVVVSLALEGRRARAEASTFKG